MIQLIIHTENLQESGYSAGDLSTFLDVWIVFGFETVHHDKSASKGIIDALPWGAHSDFSFLATGYCQLEHLIRPFQLRFFHSPLDQDMKW
jgi:hypothetical protein